ncbi:MAG TPA: RluA family pseudouridine synthase [Bryobacteraceae bacterium]|nr:RluA family pseudouridine synthase [Bryobacteraceae bacterium]
MEWIVPLEAAGQRLDHHLQARLPEFSRSRLQDWVRDGHVTLNGRQTKASLVLKGGESVTVTPANLPPLRAEAEDLPIDVLYEDDAVIGINKRAGMVVHAGAGNHTGTLVNALLHRFGALSSEGGDLRPGIVHRLDKETSGVLVVARTDAAHRSLAEQFQSRTVEKTYLALVHGVTKAESGRVEKPITRDPVRRTRMTCKLETGRHALTDWKVLRRFARHTLVEVKIGTGRTHQIRVHMASLGHPILGDTLYGAPASKLLPDRFFLHAARLRFSSPGTGKEVTLEAPLPAELTGIIEAESL